MARPSSRRSEWRPIWQLGTFFTSGAGFAAEPPSRGGSTVTVEVPPGYGTGGPIAPPPIPRVLAGRGVRGGCRRLRLRFDLGPGTYALVRSVLEPDGPDPVWCQIFFDGRELATSSTGKLPPRPAGWVSPARPGPGPTPPGYQCAAFPFVCLSPGRHELLLSMEPTVNDGLTLALDAFALVRWISAARPHSLRTDVPGRVFLDAWGWQGTTWYQRPELIGWDYIRDKMIAESAARGANYLQIHPALERPQWDPAAIGVDSDTLLRTIHAHDMLVDEHAFPPRHDEPQPAALPPNPQEVPPPGQEGRQRDPEELLRWFHERWGPIAGNAVGRGWEGAVDGFEGEAFNALFENPDPSLLARMLDALWQHNPAAWMDHASFPSGAKWLLQARYRGPNYFKSPVCLHFTSVYTPSEGRENIVGYDDKHPIRPYPGDDALHSAAGGSLYLGYQADCRVRRRRVTSHPRRANFPGGGSTPDWILKQCDDFFRPRARDPADPHETAIFWLGEPEPTLPLEYREWVYAITQDPIKHAIAATHAHGGRGGYLDTKMRRLLAEARERGVDLRNAELWKLRPRDAKPYPAETHFLQTPYWRLNLLPDREGGLVEYDHERLAHFDSDGLHVPVSCSLLTLHAGRSGARTRRSAPPHAAQASDTHAGREVTIGLPGGHLASLVERITLPVAGGTVAEQRRYLAVNDAPYLIAEIDRSWQPSSGQEDPPVELRLGCEGYDQLQPLGASGARTTTGAPQVFAAPVPRVFLLRDSRHVRPDLALLLVARGGTRRVNWRPGHSLTVAGPTTDRLTLAWLFPSDLYAPDDLPRLAEALGTLIRDQPAPLPAEGVAITNPSGVPHVAAVCLPFAQRPDVETASTSACPPVSASPPRPLSRRRRRLVDGARRPALAWRARRRE